VRLSKTSEYAVRALIYLAASDRAPCSVRHLHTKLDIPEKYLGRLMKNLADKGLLIATRGMRGGYRLAKPLADIALLDIVAAVDGLADYERCILGFPTCGDDDPCPLHEQWGPKREGIKTMLARITLADMARGGPLKF
jgi:Rrf2 family transcriptional regulator, iron-sulfur cluster assembly transcription factor